MAAGRLFVSAASSGGVGSFGSPNPNRWGAKRAARARRRPRQRPRPWCGRIGSGVGRQGRRPRRLLQRALECRPTMPRFTAAWRSPFSGKWNVAGRRSQGRTGGPTADRVHAAARCGGPSAADRRPGPLVPQEPARRSAAGALAVCPATPAGQRRGDSGIRTAAASGQDVDADRDRATPVATAKGAQGGGPVAPAGVPMAQGGGRPRPGDSTAVREKIAKIADSAEMVALEGTCGAKSAPSGRRGCITR